MSASLTRGQAENLRRALGHYEGHRGTCRDCRRMAKAGAAAGQLCYIERALFRVVDLRKEPDPGPGGLRGIVHELRNPTLSAHHD